MQIVYDGDGNRVKKIIGGVVTQYLVDDLNPTGYPQVVEELTNGALSRTYTYGLQRIGEAQFISNTWTPSFYGYDGFGTVRQLTSSTGTITDTYDYEAFGNLLNSTGSTPNIYKYRGEQWDSDLNLYYLRARYYNPTTGRFMSRDPLRGNPLMPITIHKYLYAGANPVKFIDPTGREEEEYVRIESKAAIASKFFGYIGCGASLGFVGAAYVLDKEGFLETVREDPFGPLAGVIGCIGVLASPTGAGPLALDIVGGLACADALHTTVDDFNKYAAVLDSQDQKDIGIYQFRFANDLVQSVTGCALTVYSTVFDVGDYFD